MRRDVGEVYVQIVDVALANWVGEPPSLCVHSETCGLALEHTGDLYSCDHFVEPAYRLVPPTPDATARVCAGRPEGRAARSGRVPSFG